MRLRPRGGIDEQTMYMQSHGSYLDPNVHQFFPRFLKKGSANVCVIFTGRIAVFTGFLGVPGHCVCMPVLNSLILRLMRGQAM